MRGRSIQKSDGSREKAVLESVGVYLLCLFPDGRSWKSVCPGCMGSLIMLADFPKAAGSIDGVNGWKAGLRDGLGFIHDLL